MSNQDISLLHNSHVGKMCFIVGAGPSLHFNKYSEMSDYVTIAVNSSIVKYQYADYFLSDDNGISDWDFFWSLLPKLPCKKLFYKKKLLPFKEVFPENSIYWFDHRDWKNSKEINYDGLRMAQDPSVPIIGARTSAASAINLAYIMGCDPIVLIGMDCKCIQGKNYFWEFPGEEKPKRIKNFIPVAPAAYQMKGQRLTIHSKEFLEYWHHFKIANPDINIINANTDSLLEEFKKVDYMDLLSEFKNRRK